MGCSNSKVENGKKVAGSEVEQRHHHHQKEEEEEEEKEDALVRTVWEYMCLRHNLESFKAQAADVIICLGSSDPRAATHAATLFLEGLAPWILFTGGLGTGMHSAKNLLGWEEPEAVVFAAEAERCGVPKDRILVEPKATNTGENIRFSHALLESRGLRASSRWSMKSLSRRCPRKTLV